MSSTTLPSRGIDESTTKPLWARRNVVGPGSLGYLYLVYAFVAFIFPASWYEGLIFEPYVAGYNARMLLFAVGCVVSFRVGVAYASAVQTKWSNTSVPSRAIHQDARSRALLVMTMLVIAVNLVSLAIVIQRNIDVISVVFSMEQDSGSQLKSQFVSEGGLLAANPLLILVAWALYAERLAGNKGRAVLVLMWIAILLSSTLSIVKLARYELIPLVIGIGVIKLRQHYNSNGRIDGRLLRTGTYYAVAVVGIFGLFASLRGQVAGENGLAANLAGYFIASFNRLSALFDGQLIMSYEGSGIYVLNFLSNLPLLGSAIGTFLPNNSEVFAAEFGDIEASGLVRSYNWLTMYGYYYVDLGLWVFPFCLLFGVVAQVAWKSFLSSGMLGTLLYPYLASALVLSFAFYWISRPWIAAFVIFYLLYVSCLVITNSFKSSSATMKPTETTLLSKT